MGKRRTVEYNNIKWCQTGTSYTDIYKTMTCIDDFKQKVKVAAELPFC